MTVFYIQSQTNHISVCDKDELNVLNPDLATLKEYNLVYNLYIQHSTRLAKCRFRLTFFCITSPL